jgi:hypothetical protein
LDNSSINPIPLNGTQHKTLQQQAKMEDSTIKGPRTIKSKLPTTIQKNAEKTQRKNDRKNDSKNDKKDDMQTDF